MEQCENGRVYFRQSSIKTSVLNTIAVYTLLVVFSLVLMSSSASGEGRSYLEVNGGYKTGDFGTQIRTNLYYFDTTLGYISSKYNLSVTVPYLFLSTNADGQHNIESGIGDVVTQGGVVLIPEGEKGFSISGGLAVKFPTADETKGLGTGEMDYGGFMNVQQRLGEFRMTLMGGYLIIGDSEFQDYNNIYLYGIGISKDISSNTNIYTSLEGRRSIFKGIENPLEINLGIFNILSLQYSIRANTFFGLSDGSPDFGLSLGIARWF